MPDGMPQAMRPTTQMTMATMPFVFCPMMM